MVACVFRVDIKNSKRIIIKSNIFFNLNHKKRKVGEMIYNNPQIPTMMAMIPIRV